MNVQAADEIRHALAPIPETLHDLAARLSNLRRWCGDPQALTVAEHAVRVSQHVRQTHPLLVLPALHHDDHETITGDLPAPLKDMVNAANGGVWDALERQLDAELTTAPWCRGRWSVRELRHPAIRTADREQAEKERQAMTSRLLVPLAPEQAAQLFVDEHTRAMGGLRVCS